MKICYLIICTLFYFGRLDAQADNVFTFVEDTMFVPGTRTILKGEYVETTLKDLSVVRFFKTNDNEYYVRFLVTSNFYFDKIATFEIKSGSKSSHEKEVKQYKVSKTSGLFLVEVYKNYFSTYKESGITGIVFGDAETRFTRQDANQVKKMANFFYDSINTKE